MARWKVADSITTSYVCKYCKNRYCMAWKFYMEFDFTILQQVAENVKLKSVNCTVIYYATAIKSSMKLGFIKLKPLTLNFNDSEANCKILLLKFSCHMIFIF